MQLIFDDNGLHNKLAPFSLTRPVAEIRFGILTIAESWSGLLTVDSKAVFYNTESYLQEKFPTATANEETITIAGNIKPTVELAEAVKSLGNGEALYCNGTWVATKGTEAGRKDVTLESLVKIEHCWHIFQHNGEALKNDFEWLTSGRTSAPISNTNRVLNPENIFIEPGAKVEFAILNGKKGPIYIGQDAEIMEGSIIRGSFALCDHGVVKMAAKIYGPTTIGPYCKVGGEISNCVFQAYSNKGHDGFLGNSVVGEWCNFGADTNSSNLKNNYSNVRVYSFETNQMEESDVLFCGVLMGDHSKTGINTMLNTATVVGVSANIFGGGFPSKYIPSFTWGGVDRNERFIIEKAFGVAQNMMGRRGLDLTEADKKILTHIYGNLA